ncbi:MAG: hypothetical protein KJ592_01720 [Nanoarchaeota archaeon]|nr:hypothetical protein [Nanoarchaeota archaeon]
MELKSKAVERKLNRKDFFEEIKKASSEEYETEWNDPEKIGHSKKKSKMKDGLKSRSGGGQFEARVRKDLEEKGWIVDKWSNNVELPQLDTKDQTGQGKIVPCKRVFKRFGVGKGVMTIGTGFPDFVCFEKRGELFKVIGVEVKMNGTLSKVEKEKCAWYLERGIFSEILVASKVKEKNRVRVEYVCFDEIAKRMR